MYFESFMNKITIFFIDDYKMTGGNAIEIEYQIRFLFIIFDSIFVIYRMTVKKKTKTVTTYMYIYNNHVVTLLSTATQ